MKIIIDIPADVFNLVMHGEFYRATQKDFDTLMEVFNACEIVREEQKSDNFDDTSCISQTVSDITEFRKSREVKAKGEQT